MDKNQSVSDGFWLLVMLAVTMLFVGIFTTGCGSPEVVCIEDCPGDEVRDTAPPLSTPTPYGTPIPEPPVGDSEAWKECIPDPPGKKAENCIYLIPLCHVGPNGNYKQLWFCFGQESGGKKHLGTHPDDYDGYCVRKFGCPDE